MADSGRIYRIENEKGYVVRYLAPGAELYIRDSDGITYGSLVYEDGVIKTYNTDEGIVDTSLRAASYGDEELRQQICRKRGHEVLRGGRESIHADGTKWCFRCFNWVNAEGSK